MLKELIKLANHLDSKGLVKEADYLDRIIKAANEYNKVPFNERVLRDHQRSLTTTDETTTLQGEDMFADADAKSLDNKNWNAAEQEYIPPETENQYMHERSQDAATRSQRKMEKSDFWDEDPEVEKIERLNQSRGEGKVHDVTTAHPETGETIGSNPGMHRRTFYRPSQAYLAHQKALGFTEEEARANWKNDKGN